METLKEQASKSVRVIEAQINQKMRGMKTTDDTQETKIGTLQSNQNVLQKIDVAQT